MPSETDVAGCRVSYNWMVGWYLDWVKYGAAYAANKRDGYFCKILLMTLLHNLTPVTCVKLIQHVSSAFTQFK